MILKSMTDFVLEHSQNAPLDEYNQVNETFVNKVVNYAKFLKQPLDLGMFVPCDENNNMLEKPIIPWQDNIEYEGLHNMYKSKFKQYQQAEERVLFEGFDVRDKWLIHNKYTYTSIDSFDTIEDIVNFGLELTLTKSAQKQLGL